MSWEEAIRLSVHNMKSGGVGRPGPSASRTLADSRAGLAELEDAMEGVRVHELFQQQAGAGLGPCCLTGQSVPVYLVTGARTSMLRARVQQEGPRRPGVYAMWDAYGEVIYIGKARNLRARLLSYFRKSRDPKARHILRATRAIGWEPVPDEFGALLRDLD